MILKNKAALLGQVLLRNPLELWDRIITQAEFQMDKIRRPFIHNTMDSAALIQVLGERIGAPLDRFLAEEPLQLIEKEVAERQARLVKADLVPPSFHNARLGLARLCYALCRAMQPEIIVETGVCYGVTSAFFLQALAINKKGKLWSIDLPPLPLSGVMETGALIPDRLRSRWQLERGRTRRVLPQLASDLSALDIFLHDSLHTYRNMAFEFQTVWPRLRKGGVLLSDDVAMNRAFQNFFEADHAAFSAIDGRDLFGVAIKPH
jgi:predicted O-methyltransferase YrrM